MNKSESTQVGESPRGKASSSEVEELIGGGRGKNYIQCTRVKCFILDLKLKLK